MKGTVGPGAEAFHTLPTIWILAEQTFNQCEPKQEQGPLTARALPPH